MCCAYYTQTWEETLNRAGIKASSELRKPENIVFPLALQISNQKEVAPSTLQLVKEAQSQHPPSTGQQEQGREQEILKGPFSDKVTEAPQPGAASQDFEKQLASVTLPAEGFLKGKEKKTPLETEDALRAEVPAVCRAYCAQTWEEALNQARIEASSELRKPENIIFPPALQIPCQKEVAPPAPQPVKEAQPQHPSSTSQQEQGREQEIQKGPSSDKVTVAPQPGAASQDFEKQLASVTLPA